MRSILFILILFPFLSQAFPKIPNAAMTPGRLCTRSNGHFKEYRYQERIPYCARRVSRNFRAQIYRKYNIPKKCRRLYTIDHLIPLSIGGDNSSQNLWPEHRAIKSLRQQLEQRVFEDLRDGRIIQKEAVEIILDAKFNPPIKDLSPGDPCARRL